jgi:hydrogenase maturation protease
LAERVPIRVIGCGNPDAGDDAAGLLAVRAASERLRGAAGVEFVLAGPASKAGDLLPGAQAAIVVDAVRSTDAGREPGDLFRAVAAQDGLPTPVRSALSSHGLGLADVIGIEAALGRAAYVVLLGIEAAHVQIGTAPCSAVASALDGLVDLIEEEILTIQRG